METKKANRIKQFVMKRIKQVQRKQQETTDEMQKLKLSITQVSFSHILSQFFQNKDHTFESLMRLSRAYIGTQNYQQAIVQARLAKKQTGHNGSLHKSTLILAQCKIKQNKFDDACQILQDFKTNECGREESKNYYELLLSALVNMGQQNKAYEVLDQFQQFVLKNYGQKSSQHGFYLIKKGKSLGKFQKYDQGLSNLRDAIDILIQKKCKDKKQISDIYLTMAEYYKKQGVLQKQYSSLICAHSMAKQLAEPEKSTLPILQALATNLIQREQYAEALKELKKAKELQKQVYGQSSTQMARTTKKILELLNILNLKSEARKCEQQYSRIIGTTGSQSVFYERSNILEIKNNV